MQNWILGHIYCTVDALHLKKKPFYARLVSKLAKFMLIGSLKKITKINIDIKSAEFEAYCESVEKIAKKVSWKIFLSMNVCTQYIIKDYKQ